MNLGEAIDVGLGTYHQGFVPRSLLGQLLQIARTTPEGLAGRPAAAVGVSAETWNRWLMGARGVEGGTVPSPASMRKIREAARRGSAANLPTPTRARVCANIVWNGYRNQQEWRCVNLDQLYLQAVVNAWRAGASPGTLATLFDAAVTVRYGVPVEFNDVGEDGTVDDVTVGFSP